MTNTRLTYNAGTPTQRGVLRLMYSSQNVTGGFGRNYVLMAYRVPGSYHTTQTSFPPGRYGDWRSYSLLLAVRTRRVANFTANHSSAGQQGQIPFVGYQFGTIRLHVNKGKSPLLVINLDEIDA